MTTATAPIEPLSEWDTDDTDGFITKAAAAGFVTWNVLTHSAASGPDIARLVGPEGHRHPRPKGLDAEDLYQFLYDLITEAGEVGYTLAQIDTRGFEPKAQKLRTVDLARAVAALLRIDLVEDGATFDPDYRAKSEAAEKAAAA
jgi:hypothetical protein